MAKIIEFPNCSMSADEISTRLWDAYLHRRDTADKTRDILDAIEAARSWNKWLDHFARTEQARRSK